MSILNEISELLQKGRAPMVKEAVTKALEDGITAGTILEEGLFAGMAVVGEKFKQNKVFVPEVLVAARAMNAGVEVLRPYLSDSGVKAKGTVIIGTVKGDLHDIGKNIVKIMLEGKGLTVIDIGVDQDADNFISEAINHNADIICCSTLLTSTMSEMKTIVKKAVSAGIRDNVKIMVGGAPVTQSFCESIGADFYTPDAATCADVAIKCLKD